MLCNGHWSSLVIAVTSHSMHYNIPVGTGVVELAKTTWSTRNTSTLEHKACSLGPNIEDVSLSGFEATLNLTGITLTVALVTCRINNEFLAFDQI